MDKAEKISKKAPGKTSDPAALDSYIKALKDKEPYIQWEAIESLGKIGDPMAVGPLIKILKKDFFSTRKKAAQALGKIGKPALVPLIDALNSEVSDTREYAAMALGYMGDAKTVEPLIVALKDNYSSVRAQAAEALGKIRDPRAVKPLIDALKDDEKEVWKAAAQALIKIGKPAINSLRDALKDWHTEVEVRERVITILGEIGGTRTMELLIAALKDWHEDADVRWKAAVTLCKIGDTRAVEPLIHALKDAYKYVRWNAVEALGEMGDARAIKPLFHTLKNDHPDIQKEAKNALEKIRGKIPILDFSFICSHCFYRCKKHKVKVYLLKTITYYACRNCHSNSYLLTGIEKVVLLLDRHFKKKTRQDGQTFIVNWFKKKEPFDFDEIHIINANDFDVEELVMKLKNDMDKKRRKRLPSIPVYLSPGLKLSQAKMNLLNDNFEIVNINPA